MTSDNLFTLVLGSGSPRRKELLGWLNIPFEVCTADIEETTSETDPRKVAEDLALQKGRAVRSKIEERENINPLIVSSDTVVAMNGKIYGKPDGRSGAREMLKELSGKTHTVFTGVLISFKNSDGKLVEDVFSSSTQVTFSKIDDDALEKYLLTNESLDKAGSYGIQGQGLIFISHIEGSYSNVVGFPLDQFYERLKKNLGFENDQNGDWRGLFKV